jgi:hypothetical protein
VCRRASTANETATSVAGYVFCQCARAPWSRWHAMLSVVLPSWAVCGAGQCGPASTLTIVNVECACPRQRNLDQAVLCDADAGPSATPRERHAPAEGIATSPLARFFHFPPLSTEQGRVWSRSMPCKHVDYCDRRVRMSEAAKPGPGRAMRRGGPPPRECHTPAEGITTSPRFFHFPPLSTQPGRVWSRSMPCKHVDYCERRVRMSEATKPGPGSAMRHGGRGAVSTTSRAPRARRGHHHISTLQFSHYSDTLPILKKGGMFPCLHLMHLVW